MRIPIDTEEILRALDLRWRDFEDAVQYAAALANGVDLIVTRNGRDFESGEIPVLTPGEVLAAVEDDDPRGAVP